MPPENENQPTNATEQDSAAVVVDLTKPIEEQEKPVELAPEKAADKAADAEGGERQQQQTTDDDDLEDQPGKFKKRLKREIRQKIEARAQNVVLSQDVERLQRENEELRRRPAERDDAPDTKAIDAKLDDAEKRLEKALEAGESTTAAKIQRELAELAGEKGAILRAPPRQERREEPAPRERQRNGITAMGKAFTEANSSWWTDPDQVAARSAVIALDRKLISGGSDPNSEGHYQAIAREAKKAGLKVAIRQPYDDPEGDDVGTEVDLNEERQTQRRTPPQGNNGNGRGRPNTELRDARSGKIVLSDADKETMRIFKLDPTNPTHLRAFAKSRQERILQEAQQ